MADNQAAAAPAPTTSAPAGKPSRAQVLADMPDPHGVPVEEKPAAEKPAETKAEQSDPDAEVKAADEKADAETDETEKPAEETKVEAKTTDPELAKRQDTIAKMEKRSREQMAKEKAAAKAELEEQAQRIRAEWEPKVQAAKQFDQLQQRFDQDPMAVVHHLIKNSRREWTGKDWDAFARDAYANTENGKSDPKYRAAAEQSRSFREIAERAERAERAALEMKQQLAEREQMQAVAKAEAEYLDGVVKATSDEHPLAQKLIAKNPSKARERFKSIAESLLQKYGEVPDHSDVLAAFEAERRAELEELGIDVSTAAKKSAAPVEAETKKPAKTIDTATHGHTAPVNGKKPSRSEILKEMPWDNG